MFTIHATKKLLDRTKARIEPRVDPGGVLGNWYATAWFFQPQLALLVNEATLVPVIMPLAPATTLIRRFPDALGEMLTALEVDPGFIARELLAMGDGSYAKTASRSILGTMNDYTQIVKHYRRLGLDDNPLEVALRLADMPLGPLHHRTGFPNRELRALVERSGSSDDAAKWQPG